MYAITSGCALLERQVKLDSTSTLASCLLHTKQLAPKAVQRAYRVNKVWMLQRAYFETNSFYIKKNEPELQRQRAYLIVFGSKPHIGRFAIIILSLLCPCHFLLLKRIRIHCEIRTCICVFIGHRYVHV